MTIKMRNVLCISSSIIWEWETYKKLSRRLFTWWVSFESLPLVRPEMAWDWQLTSGYWLITNWSPVSYKGSPLDHLSFMITQLRHWVVDFCSIGGWHFPILVNHIAKQQFIFIFVLGDIILCILFVCLLFQLYRHWYVDLSTWLTLQWPWHCCSI